MKKAFALFSLSLLILIDTFGQSPQGMNYQAVVHDNSGNTIPNHAIGIRFNIRQGSGSGTIVYAETQTPISDQFGGIALVIGQGAVVSGNFSSINWTSGVYFNEVLLDVTGGTNYVSMGASQLMSVPYALYANNAGATTLRSTTNYTIKINGTDVRDTSLDFVYVQNGAFITKTGHYFRFSANNQFQGVSNTTDSLQNDGPTFTNDSISQSLVYVYANPRFLGFVFTTTCLGSVVPNHLGNTYYVPLNATPVTLTVFNKWCVSGLTQWHSQTGQYYQAFPNNPAVTGYNLPQNFTVKFER